MRTRNVLGVILALVAGIMLIVFGYSVDAGILTYLELIWTTLALPMEYWPFVYTINFVLDYLARGGGFTVIAGALLVAVGWEGWGRYLVKLGTGLSILSLLWRVGKFLYINYTLFPIEELAIHTGFFILSLFTTDPIGLALLVSIIAQNLIVKVPRSVVRREKALRRAEKELEQRQKEAEQEAEKEAEPEAEREAEDTYES
ncbi:MAG: hypothetical protein ACFE89_09940 [Candidatus Hodarchaeota archaeon]